MLLACSASMRARRASRLAFVLALATPLALAACGAERAEQSAERTHVQRQALSATTLAGTSLPPKTLCLTFDDGPGYGTADISAYLAAEHIPATFFVNGAYIAATALPNDNGIKLTPNAAAILAGVVADGHLVANHGTTHRSLPVVLASFGAAKVVQELAETDTDIAPYVPSNHFLFRAPYGAYDANVYAALAPSAMSAYVGPLGWEIGGTTTNYPAQAADWACWVNGLQTGGAGATFGATPKECGDAYLAEITTKGRGIVLMHDSSHTDNGGTTFEMVKYVIPILKARGYAFVRADAVPDIAALLPPAPPSCDGSCDASADADADADAATSKDGATSDAALPPDATAPADDAAPPLTPAPEDAMAPSVPAAPSPAGPPESGCAAARARAPVDDAGTGALAVALGVLVAATRRRRRTR